MPKSRQRGLVPWTGRAEYHLERGLRPGATWCCIVSCLGCSALKRSILINPRDGKVEIAGEDSNVIQKEWRKAYLQAPRADERGWAHHDSCGERLSERNSAWHAHASLIAARTSAHRPVNAVQNAPTLCVASPRCFTSICSS